MFVTELQKGLETADEMRKRAESEIESKGEEIAALTDQLQKSKDESSLKIKSLNEDIANLRASLGKMVTAFLSWVYVGVIFDLNTNF